MELDFQEIEFHAKNFFYKCDCPIFREPYSSVFKPYSDVSNPIVAFSCKFFVNVIAPILREPYSGIFKPYSDVFKLYSSVFLQNFFISVTIPSSGSPIVAFLSPIAAFWNSTSLKSSSIHFFLFFYLFFKFYWS